MKLFVVQRLSSDYEDYDQHVLGVFSDRSFAEEVAKGASKKDHNVCYDDYEVFEVELDKINKSLKSF